MADVETRNMQASCEVDQMRDGHADALFFFFNTVCSLAYLPIWIALDWFTRGVAVSRFQPRLLHDLIVGLPK